MQEFKGWFARKFGDKMLEQRQEKKKENSLKNTLFKNRLDDGEGNDIEIPGIN